MLKGTSAELINLPDKIKIKFIKLLNQLLKHQGFYEIKHILRNYYLFTLLISLDEINGLKKFFENYKIDINLLNFKILKRLGGNLELDNIIDFKCLRFVNDFLAIKNADSLFMDKDISSMDLILYKLFMLYDDEKKRLLNYEQDNVKKKYYKLPEGLTSLILAEHNKNNPFVGKLISYYGFIFPSTLRLFKNSISDQSLVLNENLKVLDIGKWKDKLLEVPSNIITLKIKDTSYVNIIKFKRYEDSKLFSDEDRFIDFLLQFYKREQDIVDNNLVRWKYTIDNSDAKHPKWVEKQNIDDGQPFVCPLQMKTISFTSSLKELIFEDSSGRQITFNRFYLSVFTFARIPDYISILDLLYYEHKGSCHLKETQLEFYNIVLERIMSILKVYSKNEKQNISF